MKNILIILFILFSANKIKAQNYPQAGDYITNTNIDKFVGTWCWYSNTDTLILKLIKVKMNFTLPNYEKDLLIGVYKYVKAGILIEDYLPSFPSLISNFKLRKIMLSNYETDDGPNLVIGTLKDTKKLKLVNLKLTFNSSLTPTLTWLCTPENALISGPQELGTTMPKNLLLTKQ